MKKRCFLVALLVAFTSLFAACSMLFDTSSSEDNGGIESSDTGGAAVSSSSSSEDGDSSDSESSSDSVSESSSESSSDSASESSSDTSSDDGSGGTDTYTYVDFTDGEKEVLINLFGETIPFLPNDEYEFTAFSNEWGTGVNFFVAGNTAKELEGYLQEFSAYTFDGTEQDEYGVWYYYAKEDYYVDICAGEYDEVACVDVYVYYLGETGDDSSGDSSSDSDAPSEQYTYNSFTPSEKNLFIDFFGEVIPFVANNEYYVEEYTYEEEVGVNFYAYDNTQADFNEYREAFAEYTFEETYEDEYGDVWYVYSKNEYYVDMSFYEIEGGTCIDVYVYLLTEEGDSGSGGESGGNEDDEDGSAPNDDVITNDGKGLPVGENGVYDVDFTAATYVKNVTEQGYYLDGCPTVGEPAVLVIPVEFSDATAKSKGYELSVLKNAFEKNGKTDYYSVYDYYNISSYGQLALDITVLDFWFKPKNASTYYESQTTDYYGDQVPIGDQMIMDEALAYLAEIMDLSAFDSDNNGTIDAVALITTLDVGEDNFHWAYRYWNIYVNDDEEYYEYDGVSANDYLWASYQFLNEGFDSLGNVTYDDKDAVSTYTYIHEFGHIIGADDYYDTAGENEPMGGYDIMDYMLGDHNAYTKFNYGWLTESRLVTTEDSVTLTLEDFSKNGDTILLANDWDAALGAYQEYYIVVYYKSVGLNAGDAGYFSRDGIVVYHVNASLYAETIGEETYYDVYNNNTSETDEYGTKENLIEYVAQDAETYTYGVGESLATVRDDSGDKLGYTFTVDALGDDSATITFTKI